MDSINENVGNEKPIVVVGNKIDLPNMEVNEEQGKAFIDKQDSKDMMTLH